MDGIWTFLGGSACAALISGAVTLIRDHCRSHSRRSATEQALVDGVRFLLLDVIAARAVQYLNRGYVELEDKRLLSRMHRVYHEGLGGNGDLSSLMAQVDRLPLRLDP